MAQIQIEISDDYDQTRFDEILGQTQDYMLTHPMSIDCALIVHTEWGLGNVIKVVSCSVPEVLSFFSVRFDGNNRYA